KTIRKPSAAMKVLVLLVVICGAMAHLCLLSPLQRGTMNGINTAGATDCLLTTGPCGGRQPHGYPPLAFKAGSNQTVIFQKNLDHYNKTTPGYFSISFGPAQIALKEFSRVPDRGEPSLYVYTVNVTIPKKPDPFHTIQVVYVTNNTAAPPMFYQCADFQIN
ncbi:unnamed protein product, partial [Owenia fusiformis]